MSEKIDKLIDDFNDMRVELAEFPTKIIKEAKKEFASKLTEKIVFGIVAVILLAFAANLVYIVNDRDKEILEARLQAMEKIFNENLEIVE